MDNYLLIYVFLYSQRIYFSPCYKECSFPHMICLEKIPNSVSCTRCTRSLHSVSINFLCFSYIFSQNLWKINALCMSNAWLQFFIFAVCAPNLDCYTGWYFLVHSIVPSYKSSDDAILFLFETTLIH